MTPEENDIERVMGTCSLKEIDPKAARFPYCIVWAPLPIIAWLVPFVGHMGICRGDGVILDFAGSYFICVDNFTFGKTARYVKLNPSKASFSGVNVVRYDQTAARDVTASWDGALFSAMRQFQHVSYNIFVSNCHSFVTRCLNNMSYEGRSNWNMVDIVLLVVIQGKWVNSMAVVKSILPTILIGFLGGWLIGPSFFMIWFLFGTIMTLWFLLGTYGFRNLLTT